MMKLMTESRKSVQPLSLPLAAIMAAASLLVMVVQKRTQGPCQRAARSSSRARGPRAPG